jgi:class 3 adenylate cyclase/pimeloyl-ACP methyl ester carboxylesterase
MGVEPTTSYAPSADGSQIAYQALGDGPFDLVFLTGGLSHVDVRWEHPSLARFLERLASFSRLIIFDRRGVGASDRLPAGRVPSWEEWAEDLTVVMDAVGSKAAAVWAEGDGGQTAVTFVATHPDRTKALVLCNTTAQNLNSADYPCGISAEAGDFLVTFREQSWGTEAYAQALVPSLNNDSLQLAWFAKYMRATCSPRSAAEQLKAELHMNVRDVLPAVRVPTLVLHRRDLLFPPVAAGRHLVEHITGAKFVELPGTDAPPQTQYADILLDTVQEFLTGVRPVVADNRFFSTVMFTDIVDSTRLALKLGDRIWHERLDAHDAMVRRELTAYRGAEIRTTGDGFLAIFDGPGRAIRCASAIRSGARQLGIGVRIGLHAGEIEARGGDIGGITVNIGARVAALAGPDQVLVSRTVTDLVAGSALTFSDQGEHDLKGVPGRWHLFAVED